MTHHVNVELLEFASLFLHIATPDDIEHERQQMEALHEQQLAVYRISHPTHSGTHCTRVEWECL